MKAIIYGTEIEAKQADWDSNTLTGSVTKYRYPRKLLNSTTTLTKAEYAALVGIPEMLTDEEGVTADNQSYTDLSSSYTLPKCGLVVGDDYDIVDPDTGERTTPDYVVDITNQLRVNNGE